MGKQVIRWAHALTPAFLGFASGIVSFFISNLSTLNYFPGAIFGIIIGSYYVLFRKIHPMLMFFFVLLSTLAYFCACESVLLLAQAGSHLRPYESLLLKALALIVGGIVGAAILYLSGKLTLGSTTKGRSVSLFLICGGLLGISWLFIPEDQVSFKHVSLPDNYLLLFVLWQTGVSLLMRRYFAGDNKAGIKLAKR